MNDLNLLWSCIMNDLNPQWSPPEKFEFEVDEWENQFLITQVYDYNRLSKDDLIDGVPPAAYVLQG
ncbi:hypothetical protein F441_18417 [Phytophthora nicotianae CJ01A1]|uniref:C2 domain-containing protein n=4 Tax=Phytophthora nicotianae TaxID=4792 RepID=W2PMJ1_PHYN3|nr:hypothetical protein PPTG_17371 [Phytophthora nicotianae INRA-310]ETI35057.1 hypothetical protein F443_18549 [Phytophthora nicotianae P1569]ETK70904.1 hypothetical protein L915_21766 [Phytophthora nicotianae]ETP04891.1 hypothetical protein F441_18417 [Phytophthora nicotianae CJ01A1]ETL82005.1 hypothetical protein L917_17767 [Phytophthora nicotianae]ETM35218.1 hypothetical protein L914_17845 [Phytophthora nicotianae]